MNARPSLRQILRGVIEGSSAPTLRLCPEHWKVLRALAACRTPALGGQLFYCPACEREHFVAHSCRNRHCPQCQGERAMDWLAQQQAALLPIPYFHLVFTVPHALNPLIRQNRRAVFNLLFGSASQTLLEFGRQRLKAQIGITAVLHTWSQTLLDHYHLHCIVSGGGLALAGRDAAQRRREGSGWVSTPNYYLFPIQALSRMFRGKFLAGLKGLYDAAKLQFHGQLQLLAQAGEFARLLRTAAKDNWVVYAKRSFAGPKQVLKYLSGYTHRVAISNRRLLCADAHTVTFSYKDYADGARHKTMTLEVEEFVRRFCLHLLPERFAKCGTTVCWAIANATSDFNGPARFWALLPQPGRTPRRSRCQRIRRRWSPRRARVVRSVAGPRWSCCGKCLPCATPDPSRCWTLHEKPDPPIQSSPEQRAHPGVRAGLCFAIHRRAPLSPWVGATAAEPLEFRRA